MREKSKKINKRLLLVLLLVIVTIGYATLQTNLTINGTSKISNSTWNVHFNNPSAATTGSVSIDSNDNTQYAARKDSATQVSYSVLLSEPGDFYEFTVEVENEGSIDAMIDEVTSTIQIGTGTVTTINSSADLPAWLKYSVTYSDGTPIATKQKLDHGTTETYKVRVEFKKDITNEQFDDAVNKELHFVFGVKYVQKDDTAVTVDHSITMYGVYPEVNKLALNSTIPANLNLHLQKSDGIADWETVMNTTQRSLYLKHVIQNNVLKEGYVVFEMSDAYKTTLKNDYCETDESCQATVDSFNNGVFELKGGIDEEDAEDKPVFIQNAKSIYDMFGDACTENPYTTPIDSFQFYCRDSVLFAAVGTDGYIYAYDSLGWECRYEDGLFCAVQ